MNNRQLPRILICDIHISRLKPHQQMASQFFQAEIAMDEADGLSQLKKLPFHVVIIDKSLGTDFISLCLRLYPHLLVITAGETWTDEEATQLEAIGLDLNNIFEYPLSLEDFQDMAHVISSDGESPEQAYPHAEMTATTEVPMYTPPGRAQQNEAVPNYQTAPPQPRGFETQGWNTPTQQGNGYAPQGYPNQNQQQIGYNQPPMQQQARYGQQPIQQAGWGRSQGHPPMMYQNIPTTPKGVYSFYSPKGGVGKSTVCTNMGLALTKLHPQARICLVDFDIFFGNVATLLKLKSTRTVLDWVHTPDEMNEAMVFDSLIQHSSGLYVLAAPKKALEEEFITDEIADKILQHLKHYFDLVLVDLGPTFRDSTLVAFEHSEKIFLISDLDRMTLSDVYEMSNEFKGMNFPMSRVELIFNNVSGTEGVSVKQATETMPFPVLAALPSDPKVKWCTNNKEFPVVLSLPKTAFSKELMSLAMKLFSMGDNQEGKKRLSLFSFFGRKKEGGLQLR